MKTFATGDKVSAAVLNSTMWEFADYTATTTGIVLGSGGTITTRYMRPGTGDLVFFNGYIYFGTSPSTSATIHITLPVTADVAAVQWCYGAWVYRDESATEHYSGGIGGWDSTGTEISFSGAWDGSAPKDRIRPGVPVTVAAGDRLSWEGWIVAA